jgi:hypothetical protein
MDEAEWGRLIQQASGRRKPILTAETFIKKWGTFSKPVLLTVARSEKVLVVKGRQVGRAVFNDHLIALLGHALRAPVGRPAIVDVPGGLIAAEPEMNHMEPGFAHGTVFVPDCTDGAVQHVDTPGNKERFASLAVLFG